VFFLMGGREAAAFFMVQEVGGMWGEEGNKSY
jgi:hypothetical protein